MSTKSSHKANAHLTTVNTRIIGIDVHKDKFVACFEYVESASTADQSCKELISYEFKTTQGNQQQSAELIEWVKARNPEVIILESSGFYWKAILQEMEAAGLQPSLINPRHFHRPDEGRKADTADAQLLANLGRIAWGKRIDLPTSREVYRVDLASA